MYLNLSQWLTSAKLELKDGKHMLESLEGAERGNIEHQYIGFESDGTSGTQCIDTCINTCSGNWQR